MVTKKDLQYALERIAEIADLSTSKEEATDKGHDRYLHLEYAAHYGGYRLVNVGVKNGAHYGAFGLSGSERRLPAKEMMERLTGIAYGLEYTQKEANKQMGMH